MTVKEVLDLAKIRLVNVPVSKTNASLIALINLGVSVLYDQFNLSIKSETIATSPDLSLYELRNSDVLLLLSLYDHTGRELRQSDVIGGVAFDYKLVNYRSFLLKNPIVGHVYAMYKANSIKVQDENDVIDLPNSMTDALLNYVAYMSHSSINKEGISEADTWHRKFNASCVELDMKGYRVPLNTESLSVQDRGFK